MRYALDLRLRGYGDEASNVSIHIIRWTRTARLRRAVIGLAGGWGLALATAFIPLAHFVLVPAFALLGIVLFVNRMRTREPVYRARGTCPDCGVEQDLDLSTRWALPCSLTCSSCQRHLTLSLPESRD